MATENNPADIRKDLSLYTEEEYLAFRGITRQAARNERSRGKGPKFIRAGRKVYYSRDAVRNWVKGWHAK